MERSNERVLAYQLATVIDQEDLKTVSGGFGIIIPTIRVTGDPLSLDMETDGNS